MTSETGDLGNFPASEHLAAIVQWSDDAIVGKRLDGMIASWNPGAEQIFGYAETEIIGRPITVLLPEDRLGEEAALAAQLARGEQVRHFETVRQRKDGTPVDVSISVASIIDAHGKIVGVSTIARDISDLVASRRREHRQRQFMRALVGAHRAMAQSVSDAELLGEICRLCVALDSVSAAYIVEREGDEWRLASCAGLSSADSQALALLPTPRRTAAQVMATGLPVVAAAGSDSELALAQSAGLTLGAAALAAVPFRQGVEVSGALVLVASSGDFFDDAIVELLAELASDLSVAITQRARHAEFEGIVQSASDAIIAVDADRRVLRINPAAAKMFMWPAAEAQGQTIDRLIPDRFRDGHADLVARFADSETLPRRMGPARELEGRRADGSEFPIEATVSRFGQGPNLRMIVAVRDVSLRRQAEQATAARMEAEAANQAKTEFLAHMSHELRTPLNAILGFSQVLLDAHRPALGERQVGHIRQIRAAGQHLHVLISDLLDMGRLEVGRLRVQCQPLAVEDVLQDVYGIIEPLASSAGLTFHPRRALDPLPAVVADATRLRQVFLNLMSNAVKYNHAGGSVTVEASVSDEAVSICVQDTGSGMTTAQLAQLFTPYNRLGMELSRVEGTGIGLVVTKMLVDLMGATLSFDSTPGQGTRAIVSLPRASVATVQAVFSESVHGALVPEPVSGLVLSVEDNAVNQLLLEAVLSGWPGVKMLQALDGKTGLKLVGEQRPDLILLDMHLPDMNGLQFMRQLAVEFPRQSIKVLMLSASADVEDIEHALASGAAGYLTKPLDLSLFSQKLSDLLCDEH